MSPLGPEYNFQEDPAIVTVAMADPVLEMGPAPPYAASQIMISYWLFAPTEGASQRSYATSATTFDPVWLEIT